MWRRRSVSSNQVIDYVSDTRCKDNGREVENVCVRTQRELRHLNSEGEEENWNQSTEVLSFREERYNESQLESHDRLKTKHRLSSHSVLMLHYISYCLKTTDCYCGFI